jgi:hypothetical protein
LNDDTEHEEDRPSDATAEDEMIEHRPRTEPSWAAAAFDEAHLRQQAIGVRLRQMFDAVVNEEVPDEFLEILRRADQHGSEPA